jgi:YebC/PmpR family DNA-binding regulatory protein
VYVHILTDNRTRAAADVRSTFTKHNGSLGEPGSVGYLFEQRGYLLVSGDEEAVMLAAIEGGADEVEASGDQWEIISAPSALASVRGALEAAGVRIDQGEVTQLPTTSIPVSEETAPKVLRLVDALEDLDDVQAVYANFDIPDEVLVSLET